MSTSATRVTVENRLAIEDLLSEFSSRVDDGRAATVHELFIESARLETPQFALIDREQIRERFTARAKDTSRKTRHFWSNPRFTAGDGEVTVVTNVMTVISVEGQPPLVTGGSSIDVVVPGGAAWLFKSRRLEVMFEGLLSEVRR